MMPTLALCPGSRHSRHCVDEAWVRQELQRAGNETRPVNIQGTRSLEMTWPTPLQVQCRIRTQKADPSFPADCWQNQITTPAQTLLLSPPPILSEAASPYAVSLWLFTGSQLARESPLSPLSQAPDSCVQLSTLAVVSCFLSSSCLPLNPPPILPATANRV